MGEFRLV